MEGHWRHELAVQKEREPAWSSRQGDRLLACNSWPLVQLVSTGILLVYWAEEAHRL